MSVSGIVSTVGCAEAADEEDGRSEGRWIWLLERYRGALRLRPSEVIPELARLEHALLAVLELSEACGAPSVQTEIVSFLTSGACPPRALAALLETAAKTREGRALRELGLARVHVHARQALADASRRPARAKDDWSIPLPEGCTCARCKGLAKFLADRSRTRLDWPLAEEERLHIQRRIDESELPVAYTTRRAGTLPTLILRKTSALFALEAREREARDAALASLEATKDAFTPPLGDRASAWRPRFDRRGLKRLGRGAVAV